MSAVKQAAQPNMWHVAVLVEQGDIFQLGRHRLMCGDATNSKDVARLFHGEQFSLCFTSPPYSDQRTYKLGSFDWHSLMCGAFDQIIAQGKPDCHILINLGLSHKNRQVDMYWLEWLIYCASVGWPVFGWYVWDKGHGLPHENQGRLMSSHEFIYHFTQGTSLANKWIKTKEDSLVRIHGNRKADGTHRTVRSPHALGQPYKVPDSVIRITRERTSGIQTNHPAVFPVALPEFIMHTWSQPHDIIYEPFCGSGTSLIAGELLQRSVYAMEVEPIYCELSIQRWQEMTGQQAQL